MQIDYQLAFNRASQQLIDATLNPGGRLAARSAFHLRHAS
jgi:hypothetical protein